MASKTGTCNLSLGHLGISKEIGNIETEKSASAAACRRYFDISLDEVFRDFVWPFANKYADLGLVEESPNEDWAYSYRYPSDCRRLQKILSGIRNDTNDTRVPYELGNDANGKLIFTDKENAQVKYTVFISDAGLYTSDFIMMHSFLLAAYIAPRITGGDPFGLRKDAFNFYLLSQGKAQDNALNEQGNEKPVEAESIRARE